MGKLCFREIEFPEISPQKELQFMYQIVNHADKYQILPLLIEYD